MQVVSSFDFDDGTRAVREGSRRRGEPSWLTDFRITSLRTFAQLDAADERIDGVVDVGSFALGEFVRPDASTGEPTAPPNAVEEWERLGVVFSELGEAVRAHPDLVRRHLGSVLRQPLSALAALNGAAWSTGWFVHVPAGIQLDMSLQVDSEPSRPPGPFERTVIVAEEGARLQFIDGCSAPIYTPAPVLAGVVEISVAPRATVSYVAMQNVSTNVDNAVTKRGFVGAGGHLEWIEGNLGSRRTSRRPTIELGGVGASCDVATLAHAGSDQHHETGVDVQHGADETDAVVSGRSVCSGSGTVAGAGLVTVGDSVERSTANVSNDVLALDDKCADLIGADQTSSLIRPTAEQLVYLMSRGLSEHESIALVVRGFIAPITRRLPLEYAVEWSRLFELELGDAIG